MRKLSYLLTLAMLWASTAAFAQTQLSGRVTDEAGEPLSGVLITRVGGSEVAVSGADGGFTMSAAANATLNFSLLGYVSQSVGVEGRNRLDVAMKADAQALDEVVVVGYGAVRKASLTGSVASVNASKLENRAAPNLSAALSGLAAGVNVRQSSGKPGSDGANIRVRGIGTFSGDYRGPMVVVDGVESSMDAVNANDVESISILKDASSAAIYGSRAANGVILVTTKKGRSGAKPSVTYSAIFSQQQPSARQKFLYDYAEHMELHNLAAKVTNPSASLPYADLNDIAEWRAAKDDPNGMSKYGVPNFLAYPNTDWSKVIFTNQFSQTHNVQVSGGSANSNYMLSLGYLNNPGVVENTGMDRLTARINFETRITDFLKIGTNTAMMRQDQEVGNWTNVSTYFYQTLGGVVPRYEGKYGGQTAINDPSTTNNMLKLLNGQDGSERTQRINTTWYAQFKFMEGLTFDAKWNYQPRSYNRETWSTTPDAYNFRTGTVVTAGARPSDATTSRRNDEEYRNVANMLLNYNKTFGEHHSVAGLLGYEFSSYRYKGFEATMKGLMDLAITDITTGSDMNDIGGQYERQWAMVSYFGRVNYAYKNRYLFEANVRRDGSSRFSPESRWGTFPSVSGAWRISNENFFDGLRGAVNDLKIRASWGKLGNVTSGYYDWQSTYAGQYNAMGGSVANGLAVGKFANDLLQWENINSTEVGIDASFLRNRLSLELNWYNKQTEGILTSPSVYGTMGMAAAPTKNTADMRNRGVELVLSWNDRAGSFSYGATVNVAYNKSKVTSYLGQMIEEWNADKTTYSSNIGQTASFNNTHNIVTEGRQYNEFFMRKVYKGDGTYFNTDGSVNINGGPKDGMIRTEADMDWVKAMLAAGYKFGGRTAINRSNLWYGELIMSDINGDKDYGNAYDRTFTGKTDSPKYTLGLSANAAWKGFDFNMTWAGSFGMWYYLRERGINNNNFTSSGNILPAGAREMFYYYNDADPTDPNNNLDAKYPRMMTSAGAHVDSDFYLYNASYFKLKFLQLGYTLPEAWTRKIHIAKVRVFFSGENLITFTDYPGMDPEIGSAPNVYPLSRVISGGLNITF